MNKLFALILVVALLFVGVVKPVYSLPAYEVETIYFNNAKFQKEVGTRVLLCTGGKSVAGKVTPYYQKSQYPCKEGNTITQCYAIIDGVSTLVACPPPKPS